jgi:hypothetical protein
MTEGNSDIVMNVMRSIFLRPLEIKDFVPVNAE